MDFGVGGDEVELILGLRDFEGQQTQLGWQFRHQEGNQSHQQSQNHRKYLRIKEIKSAIGAKSDWHQ